LRFLGPKATATQGLSSTISAVGSRASAVAAATAEAPSFSTIGLPTERAGRGLLPSRAFVEKSSPSSSHLGLSVVCVVVVVVVVVMLWSCHCGVLWFLAVTCDILLVRKRFLHFCEIKEIHTHTKQYAAPTASIGHLCPPLRIRHGPTWTPPMRGRHGQSGRECRLGGKRKRVHFGLAAHSVSSRKMCDAKMCIAQFVQNEIETST